MERNIPDVRDIFGRSGGDTGQKQKQELRSYEYSPRSRRRHEAMESYDSRVQPHPHRSSVANTTKKGSRHRSDDLIEPIRQGKKTEENQKNVSSKSKDASYYANRTLTERDIRHLERHLSMKKTIRKQISRNLAQAFVDDPELVLNDLNIPLANKTTAKAPPPDRTFTLTRAKVSKSEQNVLDLLKDNEPDSGHCSADNPNSSDDDSHQEQLKQRHAPKSPDRMCANSRAGVHENRGRSDAAVHENRGRSDAAVHENRGRPDAANYKDDGKFSFWKMFSVKNRNKR